MIRYSINAVVQTVQEFKFPAGEVGVKLNPTNFYPERVDKVKISATLRSSDEIMALLLAIDSVKRVYTGAVIYLSIPYLPYARQDRVCNSGESFSLGVLTLILNSCNLQSVTVVEPHSDVSTALLNNCSVVSSVDIFKKVKSYWGNTFIVAPDAGAGKRCEMFAKSVGAAGVIQCIKKRDIKTGNILSVNCYDEVVGKELFVLDDLCDGGGTFVALQEVLHGYSKLEIGVVHGIFSKGVNVLTDVYDHVYTTNSYHGEIPEDMQNDKITWKGVY